jgi:hypothetical protein
MDERTYRVEQVNVLDAWQQALAEVPQTPALAGARRADLFGRFAAWYGRLRSRPRAERRRWQRQLGLSLAGIALLLAVNGAPAGAVAPAVTITVTNGTSTVANGDGCSLPEAIINANADNQSGSTDCAAGSGADTVNLQTNVTLTAVNNTSFGANGLPVVTSAVTVEGNGRTISRQAGSPDFRIMTATAPGNLTLNSATISGGVSAGSFPSSSGGGIYNRATSVTVTNSTISGNSATFGGGIRAIGVAALSVGNSTVSGNTATSIGGGIYANGTQVTVSNSTLSGNSAGSGAGGIYTLSSGLTITNSTLSGNTASNGGGIRAQLTTVTIADSTLSGNSAQFGGGMITNGPTVTILNSTVAGNTASSSAGAIYRFSGATVTALNSILAGQAAGGDCNTTLTTGGYNIESGTSCGFTGTGDQQSVSSASLALGALANNGGPTQTIALGLTSVAVDRIPIGALEANGCGVTVTTDQRGLPRASGATAGGPRCDVGAFEVQVPLAVTLASFDAQAMIDRIQLSWETVSEIDNAGFNLYRSASPAAPDALLAYVPSQSPGSTQGASYSFDDTQVAAGQTWYYWLEDVDLNGATSLHGPVSATFQAPTAVTLVALQAQAANPGSVTPWGALVASVIAAAGVIGVRRRSRAH